MVYVQNTDGTPLMPTQRHAQVKRLLRKGEAVVVCRKPYTIRLKTQKKRYVSKISLGVDTGSRHIGLSATTEKKEVFSAVAETRHDITKLISDRAMYRKLRRNRLRYRQARFNNRVGTKKQGWLPPSINNNKQFHVKIVGFVRKLLPISEIHVEVAPFDTQKMDNVDISGIEYQNGPQKDFDNVKAYVKWRDGYKCRVCGEKTHLQVHHLESRKTGGNSPGNLITLCEECHRNVHAGMKLKVRRTPSKRDAARMNIIKDRIVEEIKSANPDIPVTRTYGYITSYNRGKYHIEKSHSSDALVISKHPSAEPLSEEYELKQIRRHNRQIHKALFTRGGKRKSAQLPYLVYGFRLWDEVRYNGRLWLINGRRSSGSFSLVSIDGIEKKDGVSYRKLRLVGLSNRLMVNKKLK